MDELQALLNEYRELRDLAEIEQGKGSTEYVAYWNIVESLRKPEPRTALLGRISYAREAIARHDQQDWNRREGYRGYYEKQIELTERAAERYEAIM